VTYRPLFLNGQLDIGGGRGKGGGGGENGDLDDPAGNI
jgi:hypothetical protein